MDVRYLNECSVDEIKELLIGHRVEKVSDDTLVLDDGLELHLAGNTGGCACPAGDYDLTELNGVDNIITNVEVICDPTGDGYPAEATGTYAIFVYANNEKINLATFTGDDGNGYYGTGFSIAVRRKS